MVRNGFRPLTVVITLCFCHATESGLHRKCSPWIDQLPFSSFFFLLLPLLPLLLLLLLLICVALLTCLLFLVLCHYPLKN